MAILTREAMDNRPIGIFDSGIGGLTVFDKMREVLPSEDLVYLGDTARVPYGNKSMATILKFSIENVLFLLRHNVKLIVVACNSSSAVSLKFLSENFKIPIIGVIKPGAEHALRISKSKRIGIIGTALTIKSKAYEKELRSTSKQVRLLTKSCPLFVPLIENGWIKHPVTRQIVETYLTEFKGAVDTLVLGCTHYPIIKKVIAEYLPAVDLVDSSEQTALAVQTTLNIMNTRSAHKKGQYRIFVTDDPQGFRNVSSIFLKKKLKSAELVLNEAYI